MRTKATGLWSDNPQAYVTTANPDWFYHLSLHLLLWVIMLCWVLVPWGIGLWHIIKHLIAVL